MIGSNPVRDTAKDENFLVGLVVGNNRHALITNVINALGSDREFNLEPELLVQKEQEDVVEERGRVYFAHLVVSATHDDQTVVCGQVFHAVAKASDWGDAAHF